MVLCPVVEWNITPSRRRQVRRKILMYSKANWKGFAEDMQKVGDKIASTAQNSSVNDLWTTFKTGIEDGVNAHIPNKTSGKSFLPWINNGIRRLIKARDRLSKRCKRARRDEHRIVPFEWEEKLADLKRRVQSESRRAYWNYVESIFSTNKDDTNEFEGMKRFWRFIKYNRSIALEFLL